MSFIENIIGSFGGDEAFSNEQTKIMVFGDKGVFLEGVSGIKAFTDKEIILFRKKGEIALAGEKLFIKKFCGGDVVICGKISKIEMN